MVTIGTGLRLTGLLTSVTKNEPVTRVADIDVSVKLPVAPARWLSQVGLPSAIVTEEPPRKSSETVIGGNGGICTPGGKPIANVISTCQFASWPLMTRLLFVLIVARRDNELVHSTPSIRKLMMLPSGGGVGAGVGVGVSVGVEVSGTLNVPSVIVLVPVAPEPGTAPSVNENLPDTLVSVRVSMVMVPVPTPTDPRHSAAGLPTRSEAVALWPMV